MNKNLIYGTMALLFVLVVCISSAAADDTVTRDLPASAGAGASITVNLTVDVETGATFYSIDETVPSGWTVTNATDGGDYTSETGHVKWVVTSGAADKTYSYTVDVPADASGAYTFDGIYAFEGMTDTATILGDTTVTVGDVDTVTRDLPASAGAGASITVNLTVDVKTAATFYSIDETVPSGWTVTNATDGGDYTSETGHVKWVVTSGAADKTYSYTVDVPADASGAYTFDGIYAFEGMADTATILGDTELTVGGAAPTLDTFTVTPTTVEQGGTVDIDIAFSTEVSWAINVNNSTATVETWSGTSTNPTEKHWVTTTGTPTGDYTVDVFMNDVLVDSKTVTVTEAGAANQPPTAVIASPTASGTYREGTEVSFLSTGSTDPDGTIVSYNWTFGDGNTGTGVNTTHTYTTNGSMTVTLTVTDDDGATNSTTVTINVLPAGAVVVTLYTGWNLIAVPVNDTSANTAAELASKITGCKEVVVWDAAGDKYVTLTKVGDDWTGTDFAITGGMGIFVNVEGATTVGFTGDAWS